MGRELQIARGWLQGRAADVAQIDRAFVEASAEEDDRRRSEEERRERERQQAELAAARAQEEAASDRAEASRRLARRTMAGMLVALLLAIGAGTAGWYAWQQRNVAVAQEQRANDAVAVATADRDAALVTQSRFLSDLAAQQIAQGRGDAGSTMLLALAGLPDQSLGAGREGAEFPALRVGSGGQPLRRTF